MKEDSKDYTFVENRTRENYNKFTTKGQKVFCP
jgi:hypothetical protein